MIPVVYKIEFPDGQSYVGATVNFSERRRTHLRHAAKKKAVNPLLLSAFEKYPVCGIYQLASGFSREDLHLLDGVVIAQEQPTLNVLSTPTPLADKYSGAPKCWGPYKCLRDAARALGVTYTAAKHMAQRYTYEEYVARKAQPHKKPRLVGPPDPRKRNDLINHNGWYRRRDVAVVPHKVANKRRSLGWSDWDSLVIPIGGKNPGKQVSASSVCRKYGVPVYLYHSRRRSGWSVLESLGLTKRLTPTIRTKVKQRYITFEGKTKPLSAWAKDLGLPTSVLHSRLHIGWSEAATVTTPKKSRTPKPPAQKSATSRPLRFSVNGFTGTIREIADHFGIHHATLRSRISAAWPEECLLLGKWEKVPSKFCAQAESKPVQPLVHLRETR